MFIRRRRWSYCLMSFPSCRRNSHLPVILLRVGAWHAPFRKSLPSVVPKLHFSHRRPWRVSHLRCRLFAHCTRCRRRCCGNAFRMRPRRIVLARTDVYLPHSASAVKLDLLYPWIFLSYEADSNLLIGVQLSRSPYNMCKLCTTQSPLQDLLFVGLKKRSIERTKI